MLLLNQTKVAVRAAARRAALAILLLAACAGAVASAQPAAEAPKRAVRVTLLLFSGRPNPTFDLDPAEAAARLAPGLAETKALEAAAGESASPGVLGYNGIVVENGADARGLPRVLVVYRDRVEVRDGKTTLRRDEGRQLEGTLIKLALEHKAIDEKTLGWIDQK